MNKLLIWMKKSFPKTISRDQAKDTGMAMVLIFLLLFHFTGQRAYAIVATFLLVLDMIWPGLYRPAAFVWLGLAHLLGAVVSKVIFSLIFLLLVVPVGFVRRLIGKDTLQLKQWKKGRGSVLRARDHGFRAGDVAHPY